LFNGPVSLTAAIDGEGPEAIWLVVEVVRIRRESKAGADAGRSPSLTLPSASASMCRCRELRRLRPFRNLNRQLTHTARGLYSCRPMSDGAVVIVGGTSGIGLRLAEANAARGRTVVISGRDLERTMAIAAGVSGPGSVRPVRSSSDV
jgi:hypothetical protein